MAAPGRHIERPMTAAPCTNPLSVEAQDGVVEQSNFGDFVVPRITDMPQIAVHIVPSAEPPTGNG